MTSAATSHGRVHGKPCSSTSSAPVAGWMTKVLPLRMLTWIVGLLVTGLAVWQAFVLFA